MDELIIALLCAILALLAILGWLIWRRELQNQEASIDPLDVQQAVQQAMISSTPIMKDAVTSSITQGSDLFKGAFSASLQDLRFQEEMGVVKAAATDIKSISADLKALFEQKHARASFAEFQLEVLLRDAFPENKFGIRENLGELGTPDVNLKTADGIVIIDAKFPLENYRRIIEAPTDGERKRAAADFKRNVRDHIDKVSSYVRPGKTAPIAYAFIPSEAVFHYLSDCEPEILREAAAHNVLVSSPATLLANLSVIRISMRAQEITERATQIEANLRSLEHHFESFQSNWIIMKRHIQNARNKSDDVDRNYNQLKDKFEQVAQLRLSEPNSIEKQESD